MSAPVVLTLGRSAPPRSDGIYLDFRRHEVSRGCERAHLWPHAFQVAAAILISRGFLNTQELIAIYDDRADGGPDWAITVIRVAIHHARTRLAPLGIGFRCRPRLGYEAIEL